MEPTQRTNGQQYWNSSDEELAREIERIELNCNSAAHRPIDSPRPGTPRFDEGEISQGRQALDQDIQQAWQSTKMFSATREAYGPPPSVTLNNSNNDAVTMAEAPKRKSSLHSIFSDLFSELSISYEHTHEFLHKNPSLLKMANETGLYPVLLAIQDDPQASIPFIALLSVLLECGMNTQLVHSAIEHALELEMTMIVELLTAQVPSKTMLTELAEKYHRQDLLEWLSQKGNQESTITTITPPRHRSRSQVEVKLDKILRAATSDNKDSGSLEPDPAILKEAVKLGKDIEKNPYNVYERVSGLYELYPQLVTAKFALTGNSMLHQAILSYLDGHVLGIFEMLVLLEGAANRDAKNLNGKTPRELANNSGEKILIDLINLEVPTLEALLGLVIDYLEKSPEDLRLTILLHWLTNH